MAILSTIYKIFIEEKSKKVDSLVFKDLILLWYNDKKMEKLYMLDAVKIYKYTSNCAHLDKSARNFHQPALTYSVSIGNDKHKKSEINRLVKKYPFWIVICNWRY